MDVLEDIEEKVQQEELVVDVPLPHADKQDHVRVARSLAKPITKCSTEKIVGVPVPHFKKEIVDVPVEVLHVMKEVDGEPVPHTTKEILEEIKDILQERICERTGEQIDDGLLQCVTKEILEEIKDIPQERI